MFSLLNKLLALLPAAAMLCIVAPVQAYTVEYYTVGYFSYDPGGLSGYTAPTNTVGSPSGPTEAGSSAITLNSGSATATLTYTFSTVQTIDPFPGVASLAGRLGSFKLTDTGSVDFDHPAIPVMFNLAVYEILPQLSGKTLVGDLQGSVNGSRGSIDVVFNDQDVLKGSASVSIPDANGLTYTVNNLNAVPPTNASVGLDGSVAAPLPSTALAGLFLLGGLVCFSALKHRRLQVQ
jgi:hypothetical protein